MSLTKPEPALLQQPSPRMSFEGSNEHLDTIPTHQERPKSEYDPCALAKVGSPFYQWNHDSPRVSENKPRPDINISVHDLETGLTPQPTQHGPPLREKRSNDSGLLKNGSWGRAQLSKQEGRCMTKPKISKWKSLPHRHRLIIKIALAVIMIGLIIGLAVGLTKALGGGVWRSNNSTSSIQ